MHIQNIVVLRSKLKNSCLIHAGKVRITRGGTRRCFSLKFMIKWRAVAKSLPTPGARRSAVLADGRLGSMTYSVVDLPQMRLAYFGVRVRLI